MTSNVDFIFNFYNLFLRWFNSLSPCAVTLVVFGGLLAFLHDKMSRLPALALKLAIPVRGF